MIGSQYFCSEYGNVKTYVSYMSIRNVKAFNLWQHHLSCHAQACIMYKGIYATKLRVYIVVVPVQNYE